MFTIENHVGRLIEIRARSLDTPDEVDLMIAGIGAAARGIAADQQIVIAADYRKTSVFTQPVTARFVEMLRRFNPRLERSAFLATDGSFIARLQFERMVREAHSERRRTFVETPGFLTWVGEVLGEDERTRLRAFVDAG